MPKSPIVRKNAPCLLLWLLIFLYVIYFSAFSIQKHQGHQTYTRRRSGTRFTDGLWRKAGVRGPAPG
jgi:hypothetical protein